MGSFTRLMKWHFSLNWILSIQNSLCLLLFIFFNGLIRLARWLRLYVLNRRMSIWQFLRDNITDLFIDIFYLLRLCHVRFFNMDHCLIICSS